MAKLPESHLAAWRALLNAHAASVRRISRLLQAQGGLPLESYDVLLELFSAPDHRMRLRELQDRIVLTRSGISRLVTRLEKEALVERVSVADDGRGVSARLTEEGEAAFRKTWPLYAAGIQEVFASHMTPAEARTLADVLERVAASG